MSNISKLVEYIENAPKELKQMLISALIRGSVAAKNIEEEMLRPDPDQLIPGDKKETRRTSSNLLETMRRGEYNHQYVQHFYAVLKRADEIVRNSTPDELSQLAEKYGMGSDNQRSFNFLNEDHMRRTQGKSWKDVRSSEMDRRRTQDDNYTLEKVVINKKSYQNMFDSIPGTSANYDFSIKVSRNYVPINRIEEVTEFLHIKQIGGQYKQLEFFIPRKYWVTNPSNYAIFNELLNFQYVTINDEYGERFTYSIKKYVKAVEYNVNRVTGGGYDVLKFEAVLVQNI